MSKEQEHNEERRNWAAERNEAERKFEQLKVLSNNKQKEEADRNMAERRDITLKQSSDMEARELKTSQSEPFFRSEAKGLSCAASSPWSGP